MKKALILLSIALMAQAAFAADDYQEVEYAKLKLSPKTYKNKNVTYTAVFVQYMTTFPPYMDKSGFDTDRHIMLIVGDITVPVIARKHDAIVEQVGLLKRGQQLKIYGRVKEFKSEPEQTLAPHYYVDLDEKQGLVVLGFEKPAEGTPPPSQSLPPPRRPRPWRRR